jgi:Lrp/AsnC family transcriptional regulator
MSTRPKYSFISIDIGINLRNTQHMTNIDSIDRKILSVLQRDATLSLDVIGEKVGLSRNACWRRIRTLEETGVITKRIALVDPAKVGFGLTVFMQIRTNSHAPDWLQKFSTATKTMPEIQGVYRMSGDLDYLIRARVADMAGYDKLYQRLIALVPLSDASASFVMEEIKETSELPL